MRKILIASVITLVHLGGVCYADGDSGVNKKLDALVKRISELEATVMDQSSSIKELKAENSALTQASQAQTGTKVQMGGRSSSSPSSSQPFTPEIGVVADIVGTLTESKEDSEGNDRLSVREVEVVFGHDIDPFSRLDSTIAFSDGEDPEVEEAYVSYWDLPLSSKVRFGRIRPKIGYTNPLHRDSLETVDEPLVIQRYLGVEGLSRTAFEGSTYLPFPWESVSHEVILGVMEGGIGEEGSMFGDTRRRPSFYARLRNSTEFSDLTAADLGGTFMLGSSDEDSANEVRGFGVDLNLVHFVTPVNKLTFRTEAIFQDRTSHYAEVEDEHGGGTEAEDDLDHHDEIPLFDKSPFGFYSLIDYRLSERFSIGSRFDYVEPVNFADEYLHDGESALSGYITFHQSEFARLRAQYQHLSQLEGGDDNRFFLQGTFAIGTHKHSIN